MGSNVERELGQLTEAVSGLKDAVVRLDGKFDAHVVEQAKKDEMQSYRLGRLAGTVSLIVTVGVAIAKEAAARLINR